VAAGHSLEPARWQAGLGELLGRVAGRFGRVEPRRRARAFVLGLLADLPRKNCWTIAEHAGNPSPDGRQHLLGPGETGAALRHAMAARAAGGPTLEAPYDDLARQIGQAAYKVTDEQVASVVERAGSERAAFELIVASALGAGLHRWRRGLKALEEAAEVST
jgi:hypothetical protein